MVALLCWVDMLPHMVSPHRKLLYKVRETFSPLGTFESFFELVIFLATFSILVLFSLLLVSLYFGKF